jgi:O-antigen ligase
MITRLLDRYRPEIEKLNLYTAIALAFALPFYKFLITPIVLIWMLSWLLEGNFKTKYLNISYKTLFFIIISFYILHVIGLFYSENTKSAFFDLEVKFSLFVFPIIIAFANNLYKKNFRAFLFAFVAGNLFASLICLINALYHSIGFNGTELFFNTVVLNKEFSFWESITHGGNYFFYEKLSVFHHTTYFSMYLAFSIVILLYLLKNANTHRKIKIFYVLIIMFFTIMIFLLSSRAGIIVIIGIVGINILIQLLKKLKPILKISMILLSVSLFAGLIFFNPRFKVLSTIIKSFNEYSANNNEKQNLEYNFSRILIWQASSEIIHENIMFGVGTGDVKNNLIEKYQQDKFQSILIQKLNAHNQFIETWIGLGVVGFITLLLLFILPLTSLVKNNKFLIVFFLFIVGFNFLFESMLNTQAGVVFFSLFYSLLVFIPKDEKTENYFPK